MTKRVMNTVLQLDILLVVLVEVLAVELGSAGRRRSPRAGGSTVVRLAYRPFVTE